MPANQNALPTHAQIFFFRFGYTHFEYLLVQRADPSDPLWQPITEAISHGNVAETVKWAASRQLNLHHFKRVSDQTASYEWYTNGQKGRDIVFAIELDADVSPEVDPARYSQWQWFRFEDAMQHIKWSGAKDALRKFDKYLQAKRINDPTYWEAPSSGLYGHGRLPESPADLVATKATTDQHGQHGSDPGHNPYGPNVPKRLPDRPEDSHERQDDDETDLNTGEWFL